MECGECTACCKVFPINSLEVLKEKEVESIIVSSAEGDLCTHCEENVGCTVYNDRPQICRTFDCLYIEEDIDNGMRPDKTGVIFEKVTTKIYHGVVDKDCLDTWKSEEMLAHLDKYNQQGISVLVSSFGTGLLEAFCAENHPKEKVVQIAQSLYMQRGK